VSTVEPTRRSQRARREATVRKLLDATRETLVNEGYARASIQTICAAAGVSHGGLFRHFSSRIELMIRASEDIGAQLLDQYRHGFETRAARPDRLATALDLVRANARSRAHQAWFELLMAARTDRELRGALKPIWARMQRAAHTLAAELLPEPAGANPAAFAAGVDLVVTLFHGEGVDRFIHRDGAAERARLALLTELLRSQFKV